MQDQRKITLNKKIEESRNECKQTFGIGSKSNVASKIIEQFGSSNPFGNVPSMRETNARLSSANRSTHKRHRKQKHDIRELNQKQDDPRIMCNISNVEIKEPKWIRENKENAKVYNTIEICSTKNGVYNHMSNLDSTTSLTLNSPNNMNNQNIKKSK